MKNRITFASCTTTCIVSRTEVTIAAERLTQPESKRKANYAIIEDEPEDLLNKENESLDSVNEFLSELYKNRYNDNLFETNPDRMIKL